MKLSSESELALYGGSKSRQSPWPARFLYGDEEERAILGLVRQARRSGHAFGYHGEEELAYCREFAEYLGGGFADGVNSGSSGVWVALRALGIDPFTEVIVAPTSDQGSFMPVPLNNCIPIPADCTPGSHNAGPEQIEERITDCTSAIIVVHTAGYPVDMDPIMEIARSRGLAVIEDAAQAHGATYKGRMVGTIGDIGVFSTMFGKQHMTGGQGGVVFTKDESLYYSILRVADRGKGYGLAEPPPDVRLHVVAAHNMNMDELSAAIGRAQLKKLPGYIAARRRFVGRLTDAIEKHLQSIRVVPSLSQTESSYWRVFIEMDLDLLDVDRDTFMNALRAEGIPANPYRYPITDFSWYQERKVFGTSGYPWTSPLYKGDPDQTYPLPNLDDVDRRQFYLTMHERCGEQEVGDVVNAMKKLEAAYLR